MQAPIVPARDRIIPAEGVVPASDPFWQDVEPEDLEDLARRLCASRPGSRAAERLMERASYIRALRAGPSAGRPSALLFS